ncbi:MAG: sigma-54-dependent Fis family transcriptional regulator [Desulfobacteraceae bacterium]|nr:sigma-54-dependent Fis family transcriptional regulator [Desulfobacteraceae bacterium]
METIPAKSPILIVDDDDGLLLSIRAALLSAGLPEPALVSDCRRACSLVKEHQFHLAMLDLVMPHICGMDVLKQIRQKSPATECIIITAVDDVALAVQAMKFGAYDYIVKPLNLKRTTIAISHALERYQLKQGIALFEHPQSFSDLKHPEVFSSMIARDEAMALVFRQAEICAESDYNVMITGETGAGKGMLARAIHKLSRRSEGPMVSVNMPAFSQNLFEDDFFGHIRGAYTGAISDKRGFFEAADGGTLFLDEITELASATQGKLLQVIEEKRFYRLGSTDSMSVDLRLLSASNKDVSKEVATGRFRGDLYFRLNEYHIHIPPLRRRPKDILILANYFLRRHAAKNRKNITGISSELSEILVRYSYPGNVRELENVIASTVLVETKNELSFGAAKNLLSDQLMCGSEGDKFPTLEELEIQHIKKALKRTNGNRTRSAKILGISLRTLQRKIKSIENL